MFIDKIKYLCVAVLLGFSCIAETEAQPWFPLEEDSRWTFIDFEITNVYSRASFIEAKVFDTDTVDGKVYYLTDVFKPGRTQWWLRYDDDLEKLFILSSGEEKLFFDFTTPAVHDTAISFEGSPYTFWHVNRGSAANAYNKEMPLRDYIRFDQPGGLTFMRGVGIHTFMFGSQYVDGRKLYAAASSADTLQLYTLEYLYSICFDPAMHDSLMFDVNFEQPFRFRSSGTISLPSYKTVVVEMSYAEPTETDDLTEVELQNLGYTQYRAKIKPDLGILDQGGTLYYRYRLESHAEYLEPQYYPGEGFLEYKIK